LKILVVHGPNLNLLGKREPEIYGERSLEDLDAFLHAHAEKRGVKLETFQSNHEGTIVDRIHAAAYGGGKERAGAIVINPGAYTHTSLAIADALRGAGLPAVEVHLSNLHQREEIRSKSLTASACLGQICGFGFESYKLGIDAVIPACES
jgi:3-dehydroquinate dehydratase-2